MIDILNQRVQMNPEKVFVQYKNQNISYKQFNNIVDNISNTIKLDNLRADYIGLQIIGSSYMVIDTILMIHLLYLV